MQGRGNTHPHSTGFSNSAPRAASTAPLAESAISSSTASVYVIRWNGVHATCGGVGFSGAKESDTPGARGAAHSTGGAQALLEWGWVGVCVAGSFANRAGAWVWFGGALHHHLDHLDSLSHLSPTPGPSAKARTALTRSMASASYILDTNSRSS